jgi:two-component system response regulator PilR (NtrC family)
MSIDVRVVAATHRNLAEMVAQGSFRLDLYHRLNAFVLELPPLRERPEEIPHLASHFVESFAERGICAARSISPEALSLLMDYRWPGNVRELRNVIERALALTDRSVITPADLPTHVRHRCPGRTSTQPALQVPSFPEQGVDLRAELEEQELQLIQRALEHSKGHQRRAAELLRLPLRTLERKLQKLSGRSEDPG